MSDIVHPDRDIRGGPIEDQFEVAIDAAVSDAAYYADESVDPAELVSTMEHYLEHLRQWERGDDCHFIDQRLGEGLKEGGER